MCSYHKNCTCRKRAIQGQIIKLLEMRELKYLNIESVQC